MTEASSGLRFHSLATSKFTSNDVPISHDNVLNLNRFSTAACDKLGFLCLFLSEQNNSFLSKAPV